MKTLNEIAVELQSLSSVLIFCHIHPDGDTLGSAVALKRALLKLGKACDIVCDDEIPEKYAYIPDFLSILKPNQVGRVYEGHVAVDVATEGLLGLAWSIYNSSKKRICIDHHRSNEQYAPITHVRESASTTVLIYNLIKLMQVDIDEYMAKSILLGIITDTGNFNHSNTDSEVLKIAAEVVLLGASVNETVKILYKSQSKNQVKLYTDVMSGMRFYLQDRLAIITVFQSDLQKYSLKADVTEGWVDDLPMAVAKVEVGVSLLQTKNNLYRVSIRSRGKVNAIDVAGEFGGGGHRLASGCVISGSYEEVLEKIIRAVDINLY